MNIVPRNHLFNIDQYFDDLFTHSQLKGRDGYFEPRVDIIDKQDCYLFVAELPGVDKQDIDISFESGYLTIEAKVNQTETKEKGNYLRKECSSGYFRKTINLADKVDATEISAEYINGLLKLRAPKKASIENVKQKIEIH